MANGVKRIKVGQKDSLESVLKQISKARNASVVLYIPKGSELVKEAKHLTELYSHAKSLGKELSIESVDDEVLAMASLVGIKAGNAFYGAGPKRVADILPRKPEMIAVKEKDYSPVVLSKKKAEQEAAGGESKSKKENERSFFKSFIKLAVIAIVLAGGVYYCVAVLPSAAITLNFNQTPWNFTGQMTVGTNQTQVSFGNNQVSIPGQLFDATKTMTQVFTASGTQYVRTKSAGQVTIYNDFGTASQTLVATTRLINSDGVMFRLDKTVVVPGATYSGGKLVPSQITASVTANEAGSQYNLPSGQKFHFAGFEGTKKYNGFYAESSQAMSGGFIGQTLAPSRNDIIQATSSVAASLQNAMASEAILQAPQGMKFINGGSSFSVTKYDVANIPNSNGQFAVTAYGEYKIIGFNEQDLVTAMASQVADSSTSNLQIKKYTVTYGTPVMDWKRGTMTASIAFQSFWEPQFDVNSFRQTIVGRSQEAVQQAIRGIAGIQSGEVKLWPFWVRSVPDNLSRVTVDTN